MKIETLRVNGKRLRESLERMAEIGATPGGGVQRLTLTDEDRRARDLFVSWLREIDCTVTVDRMGNIFGRRAGRDDGLAARDERLAHRFPAQGRPVRRHPGGHGRAGGPAHSARELESAPSGRW